MLPLSKPTIPDAVKHIHELYGAFTDALNTKEYANTAILGEELCRLDNDPMDRYNLGCVYLCQNRSDDAMTKLHESVDFAANNLSFRIGDLLWDDSNIDPLRAHPDFARLQERADAAQWEPMPLHYDTDATPDPIVSRYSTPDNEYLTRLRTKYALDTLIAGSRGDLERVKLLCTWVHTRWSHIGDTHSQPLDPIGLLEAAEKGDNFRCVEYGVTVAGCLSAVGIPARTVAARAQDVETRRFGAGHVFAEAYLRDRKKWVFVDPQLNVVGEKDGEPLNTVDFYAAFAAPRPQVHYSKTLGSCLYTLVYRMDETYPVEARQNDRAALIPKNAAVPCLFQRVPAEPFARVTHNPADVYAAPMP